MTASELYNELTLYFWEEDVPMFPEIFAGAYISEDYLVILLTDLNEESLAYFENIVDYENIIFREVDFSYNYLMALGEQILEGFSSVLWWGINVSNNRIEITFDMENENSLHEANMISPALPVDIYFSTEIESTFLEPELYFEDIYYERPPENLNLYYENNGINPTLIVLSTVFLFLVFFSFFVVKKRAL